MKNPFWFFGAIVTVLLFAVAFGYFDPELTAVHRLVGCGLIAVAVALAVPAMWRLVDDWPRAKPQHSLDGAFARIALAAIVLGVASVVSHRSQELVAVFSERLPDLAALRNLAAGNPPSGP